MARTPEAFFAESPINRELGFRLLRSEDGCGEVALTPRPELLQEGGVVHGGVLSALADTAGVYALLPRAIEDGRFLTGIEFKVNFLSPARLEGGDLVARSRITKRGRTLAIVEVDVFQGERPVATAIFTHKFLSPRS